MSFLLIRKFSLSPCSFLLQSEAAGPWIEYCIYFLPPQPPFQPADSGPPVSAALPDFGLFQVAHCYSALRDSPCLPHRQEFYSPSLLFRRCSARKLHIISSVKVSLCRLCAATAVITTVDILCACTCKCLVWREIITLSSWVAAFQFGFYELDLKNK